MSINQLVLLPKDPVLEPPTKAALLDVLRAGGLIGDAFDYYGVTRYHPGPGFLNLFTFVGSQTIIELKLEQGRFVEGGRYDSRTRCMIDVPNYYDTIEFLGGGNIEDPLCPACGYEEKNWTDPLDGWCDHGPDYRWTCPVCIAASLLWKLDWRQTCGFGRCTVRIESIYQGEAQPSQELLSVLQGLTGESWTYFYLHL